MLVGCSLYISNKSSAPFPCLCFSLPTFHFSSAYGECDGSVKSLLLVCSNGFQMLTEACPWSTLDSIACLCSDTLECPACLDVTVGNAKGYSIGTEDFSCDSWFVTDKSVNNWFPPPFYVFPSWFPRIQNQHREEVVLFAGRSACLNLCCSVDIHLNNPTHK